MAGQSIGPVLQQQPGDNPPTPFSFLTERITTLQVNCHLTATTEETHRVVAENLDRSAMYSGRIEGVGPRYCPSIEDKVVRFEDRSSHQIFLEPEGLDDHTIYPNGISTSLPEDVQAAVSEDHPRVSSARRSCGRAMPLNMIMSIQENCCRALRPRPCRVSFSPVRSMEQRAMRKPLRKDCSQA